jgi:dTDP-4-dehydrorhamnose reductase
MPHERVLITGCGGMLGSAIYPYFNERCSAVLATDIQVDEDEQDWLSYLDARDETAMRKICAEFKPDLLLHLAAMTDLEECELRPKEAEEHCALTTKIATECAATYGATLVYVSTAGVFDGAKPDGVYSEDDAPNPIMVYGRAKLGGERHVQEIGGRSYIVRAGWMVGGGVRNDHKFVRHIVDQLQEGARIIYAVNDRLGTPTYTHDFAMNLFELLERKSYGTYHMACQGNGSRFDVAREIVRHSCPANSVEVKAVDSNFFRKRYFAPRPRSEMLINKRLDELKINKMRRWDVALGEYLLKEYRHLFPKLCELSNGADDQKRDSISVEAGSLERH